MSNNWTQFLKCAEQKYPNTFSQASPFLSENLVADCDLELPKAVKSEAEEIVKTFFELRNSQIYQNLVGAPDFRPKNFSALMSYDFHFSDDSLKLIEINTNASSSLMAEILYLSRNLENPYCENFSREILKTFKQEFDLVLQRPLKSVWILDENPQGQRLFAEFLFYKELFETAGYNTKIIDSRFLPNEIDCDLIYNRSTDFYFEDIALKNVRAAFEAEKVVISPNPSEYHLLANKNRLVDIYTNLDQLGLGKSEREIIGSTLLKCQKISSQNEIEELWTNRKSLFFKPLASYGGKATYRGTSITKKVFTELFSERNLGKYMAQEFKPAPEREFNTTQGPKRFKFDLRFYVYQDKIQNAVARLYQGQTTNLQTLGGGLAPIKFI